MAKDISTLKLLVEANSKRVVELLKNENITGDNYYNPEKSELKIKMRELRRDTKRLEKDLYSLK